MKTIFIGCTLLLLAFTSNSSSSIGLKGKGAFEATSAIDLEVLKGNWTLDMSPHDKTDANVAKMSISSVNKNTFEGSFYRDGVKIREGRINTQLGIIYGALISGDNSGMYNTTFYYKEGSLYGSTHSLDKDFLSVWIATKENN